MSVPLSDVLNLIVIRIALTALPAVSELILLYRAVLSRTAIYEIRTSTNAAQRFIPQSSPVAPEQYTTVSYALNTNLLNIFLVIGSV